MTLRALSILTVAGLLAPYAWQSLSARQAPQTHWEQYKNRPATPVADQHLTDPALIGAIDLHAHHDPDSYPRELDGFEVAKLARDRGLRGIVLKNHWTETAGLAYLARKYATPGFEVFGAVTLDTAVGGVNPQAVRYMVDVVGNRGRIVWMPTHDSEHEVRYNKESRPFVSVSRAGKLLPPVHEVIALVAQHDLALATGHVTPEETLLILRAAKAAGVKRLIVTHPLLDPQFTYMSIEQLACRCRSRRVHRDHRWRGDPRRRTEESSAGRAPCDRRRALLRRERCGARRTGESHRHAGARGQSAARGRHL